MTDRPPKAGTPTTIEDPQAPADTALSDGDRLGNRYLLRSRIGAGGMSVVWKAWDEALQRPVAVKVMHAPLSSGPGDRETIRREARAAARIEHPNAMEVYDVGETITSGGRLTSYVVMRLLDGHSLADLLDDGPLAWQDAVDVVCRVAEVLAAAHGRGIVHRDVTPENVMLTDDGAKLLDFGIAARVGERDDEISSPVFGTPPYVAPERLRGAEAAGATDVYALGVLMFQVLTGRPPYPETTWEELETADRTDRPPRPGGVAGLPRRVARLCRRCLATDPADRPTAAEVAAVLNKVLYSESHHVQRIAHRFLWIATACLVIVATAIVATGPSLRAPSGERTEPATSEAAPPAPGVIGEAPSPSPSRSRRSPSPTHSSAPPAALSVAQAAAAAHELLDRGVAEGTIRPDVAFDFSQQIDTFVGDPGPEPAERQRRLDNIRRHITDRLREEAIAQALATELDAALTTLGTAVEREVAGASAAASPG
ncbi:MAG: serine/threonine protein kinase [Dactylosporangium sp.]|nr:serine/threonine protein kinase [Dactylosporangium sp.]NNJ61265.1 serine/threonine protein kinase [Dactylosporangium sp.]